MKSVAAIFVALCLIHPQNINADVKVLRKSVITDKKLALWIKSYTDEHHTYARCDNTHLQTDDINCTVFREKKPYGDDTYFCNVTLKRPDGHVPVFFLHISVYPFGQKYVAVGWEENKYLNFTVVQMDNCRVSEAGFYIGSLLDWFHVRVVGHTDSFDVFFDDVALCGDKTCKATVGVDGRIINEPKPAIKKYVTTYPMYRPVVALDNGPSGNGHFYVTEDGKDYVQMLVKPDGTEKSLARHPKPSGIIAVSRKNNLLGACYQMNDEFECKQYDYDGNLKFNTTITSDDKGHRLYLDIYNLPTGGFYVFSAECERKEYYCVDFPRYLIERVDADGRKFGPIVFQGVDITFDYAVDSPIFYENESKEVCFSLGGTSNFADRTELAANCFTDADFSK